MTLNARAKSAILILASVGVGIILGMLLQARLAEQRLERLALLRSERGLVRALERVIEPVDEEQNQAIQEVLAWSAQNMADQIRQNREASITLLDSTMQALREILTDEQIEQLDQRMEQWADRMRTQRERRRRPQRHRDRDRTPPPR